MILPATAVMKAWTPPVKIPITFPWAACVCMFAAMARTMSAEFDLHRANDVA